MGKKQSLHACGAAVLCTVSKNTPFTFVLNGQDGGAVAVCAADLSVTDAAHCFGCVDGLSGASSATVVHTEKCNLNTAASREAKL